MARRARAEFCVPLLRGPTTCGDEELGARRSVGSPVFRQGVGFGLSRAERGRRTQKGAGRETGTGRGGFWQAVDGPRAMQCAMLMRRGVVAGATRRLPRRF